MRILHVIESLDPAAGGTAVVAARLAVAQAKLGHAVGILAEKLAAAEKLGDLTGVQIIPAQPVSRRRAVFGRSAVEQLRPLVRDADVLHLHGVWDPLIYAAAKTARSLGKPYLVAPHGMLDPWSLAQSRWKKKLALAIGWRTMLNRAAAIHWLNADEQKLAHSLGLTAPGFVIPNGIDIEAFDPISPPDAFRARLPALGNGPYVLFLSRLHYKKGLDYLADAFAIIAKKFADVHLVVAGPDDGARADFEGQVAIAGLTGRVHVPGPVYGPEKLSAVAGAACFVLPSRQEGFSMAILEALASGTPAVVSEACHFPEVAEVAAGEVVPLEPVAIAAAIGRILADPELGRRMGRAGRELVAARFTWPRIAGQSIEAYVRVVSGPSA